jgi:NADH:ubiquinone oxidoreductase subunit 5 (subunit L)/multisubunit Na+/H+ antiporter MnhA subunit
MDMLFSHLAILPIVLPLAAGVLLVLVEDRHHTAKLVIDMVATAALLAVSVLLLVHTSGNGAALATYRLGDWPAPFAIVLVADRLSALMVVLTAILAVTSLIASASRWHRAGRHFHSLFQLLLMGLNGAFLTGDLFNLFVFFEVLLAASYGLLLALATGAGAWLFGHPFLTSSFQYLDVPLLGRVPVASALLFDLGVFVLVVGATVLILVAIAHQSVRGGQPTRLRPPRIDPPPADGMGSN